MLERAGTILVSGRRQVRVRLDEPAACAGCAGRCGIGPLLARLRSGAETYDIPVADGHAFANGDRIVLCLPAPRMQQAALLAYGPPLAGLLTGALLGSRLPALAGDAGTLAGLLLGLGLGLLLARVAGRRFRTAPFLRRNPAGATA